MSEPTGPGVEGFRTLAARHRIVPVWRELVADTVTPVAAFLQIVGTGDTTGFLAWGVKVYARFSLTPEQGARTSVYLCSSPDVADVTGRYFVKCREKTPSPTCGASGSCRPRTGSTSTP